METSKYPQEIRRPRAARRAVLIGLVALVSLVLLEGGFRIWLLVEGRAYAPSSARARIADLVAGIDEVVPSAGRGEGDGAQALQAKITESWALHPFFGFTNIGFLSEAIAAAGPPRPEGEYRVLILGGSVSAQIFRYGGEVLRTRLQASPRMEGRRVRLFNGGAGAYKQPQQVNVLTYLLSLGLQPDLVVNIDGFNEVATCNDNAHHGVHPIYPSWFHWQHLVSQERIDGELLDGMAATRAAHQEVEGLAHRWIDSPLLASSIVGELVLARIRAGRKTYYRAHQAYNELLASRAQGFAHQGPPFAGDLDETIDLTIRIWEEASFAIQTLCAGRSIRYLHVLQPTLHDQGSKPLTEEELRHGQARPSWVEGVHAGYPRLRAAAGWLREHGIDYLDASLLFAAESGPIYIDNCHYNTAGCEMLAATIAEHLLADLENR